MHADIYKDRLREFAKHQLDVGQLSEDIVNQELGDGLS
jgi:hypothetical protein